MNNTSLSSIIRSLQLRDIHNMPTHTRRSHKTPISIVLQLLPIGRSPLRLLAAPVLTRRARGVEGSVQIRGDHLVVVRDLAVEHGALRPGDAGVGDEDVETAAEVFDGLVYGGFDGLVGGDVYLVRLAWDGC